MHWSSSVSRGKARPRGEQEGEENDSLSDIVLETLQSRPMKALMILNTILFLSTVVVIALTYKDAHGTYIRAKGFIEDNIALEGYVTTPEDGRDSDAGDHVQLARTVGVFMAERYLGSSGSSTSSSVEVGSAIFTNMVPHLIRSIGEVDYTAVAERLVPMLEQFVGDIQQKHKFRQGLSSGYQYHPQGNSYYTEHYFFTYPEYAEYYAGMDDISRAMSLLSSILRPAMYAGLNPQSPNPAHMSYSTLVPSSVFFHQFSCMYLYPSIQSYGEQSDYSSYYKEGGWGGLRNAIEQREIFQHMDYYCLSDLVSDLKDIVVSYTTHGYRCWMHDFPGSYYGYWSWCSTYKRDVSLWPVALFMAGGSSIPSILEYAQFLGSQGKAGDWNALAATCQDMVDRLDGVQWKGDTASDGHWNAVSQMKSVTNVLGMTCEGFSTMRNLHYVVVNDRQGGDGAAQEELLLLSAGQDAEEATKAQKTSKSTKASYSETNGHLLDKYRRKTNGADSARVVNTVLGCFTAVFVVVGVVLIYRHGKRALYLDRRTADESTLFYMDVFPASTLLVMLFNFMIGMFFLMAAVDIAGDSWDLRNQIHTVLSDPGDGLTFLARSAAVSQMPEWLLGDADGTLGPLLKEVVEKLFPTASWVSWGSTQVEKHVVQNRDRLFNTDTFNSVMRPTSLVRDVSLRFVSAFTGYKTPAQDKEGPGILDHSPFQPTAMEKLAETQMKEIDDWGAAGKSCLDLVYAIWKVDWSSWDPDSRITRVAGELRPMCFYFAELGNVKLPMPPGSDTPMPDTPAPDTPAPDTSESGTEFVLRWNADKKLPTDQALSKLLSELLKFQVSVRIVDPDNTSRGSTAKRLMKQLTTSSGKGYTVPVTFVFVGEQAETGTDALEGKIARDAPGTAAALGGESIQRVPDHTPVPAAGSPRSQDDKGDDKYNKLTIAIAVVGAILVIVVIVLVVMAGKLKQSRRSSQHSPTDVTLSDSFVDNK